MSGKMGFGLVRDRDGNPKIDDPSSLHPSLVQMLTVEERQRFGLWTGPQARDAQGVKKLEKLSGGYRAVDDLVAVSEIFDGNDCYRMIERVDVKAGYDISMEMMKWV